MNECYLCGNTFNDLNTKKHEEHILQQAIGGNLTANDILCEKCGNTLGTDIDIPFNKTFQEISGLLDIKTERGNNKTPKINAKYKGKHDKYGIAIGEIDIIVSNRKVSPRKPFHKYTNDKTKVVIYAEEKTAKKYKEKVQKEIARDFTEESAPHIIICDDIDGPIEYPLNIENNAFKRGMAKIAIGFALKCGVKREHLPRVLSIDKSTGQASIMKRIDLVQFYPLSSIDKCLEENRHNLAHYPSHTLILFNTCTKPSSLVCYIELFSTFQWYVILNKDYQDQNLYEYYAQNIMKKEGNEFDPGLRYYKERNIYLEELGINEERIEKKFAQLDGKKTKEEVEFEVIREEQNKQKYKLDFEVHIEDIINFAARMIILKSKNTLEKFNLRENLHLYYYTTNEDDEIFRIYPYRRLYHNGEHRDYLHDLIMHKESKRNQNNLIKYGHQKVHNLFSYIQKIMIERKFENNE